MCIEYIYKHIGKLPRTQIFTTRAMLIYGTRSAVDSAMSRLVKSGFIRRLARGVFIRDKFCMPPMLEIVEAKAKAFKTAVRKHAQYILKELKIAPEPDENLFVKVGHSSSFETVHGRAYLHGVCTKKFLLSDTKVGSIIYALWYWGDRRCQMGHIWLATRSFGRKEKEELWLRGALMPAWLNEALSDHFPPFPRVTVENIFA